MRLLSIASFVGSLVVACGGESETVGSGGDVGEKTTTAATTTSSVSTSATDATSGTEATSGTGGAACATNDIEMIVSSSGGVPDRFHVRVRRDGTDAALLFDTGSATTFVMLGEDAPAFVPDAAAIDLGCDAITVDGRGGLADLGEVDGLRVIGILGVDYVASGTTLIDPAAARLTRHPSGTTLPGTPAWSALPYDDVLGHMIAPLTLDGTAVRLMVDTGAPHILWLGEEGQPGDQEVTTTDAEGTPITLYYGDVALEMAGEPQRTAPVLRAPSFPYFEMTVAALGGNIHGLLGLSAFEDRRYVIDGAQHRVLIEP